MKKPQIHVSGLQTLWKCGIQYENRHILGLKTPTAVNLIVGTGVHKGLQADLEEKKATGKAGKLSDVQDIARDSVTTALKSEEVEASPEDIDDGFTKDAAVDKAVNLVELGHDEAVPRLLNGDDKSKMHIERQWTLDVEGLPFQLAGTMDVQQGTDYIEDWKTSGKSPVKSSAETSAQLTMYAMATKVLDGEIPKVLGLNYLIQTPKRGDTKLVELRTDRKEEDFFPLLARINLAHAQIQSGTFHPAPMDSWQCSDKWCGFFRTCPYSNKRTLMTIGELGK